MEEAPGKQSCCLAGCHLSVVGPGRRVSRGTNLTGALVHIICAESRLFLSAVYRGSRLNS